VHKVFKEGALI